MSTTPEQQAELDQLGIKLTPYLLPQGTEEDRAIAWELMSRYVTESGRVGTRVFGGDCIALGRALGSVDRERLTALLLAWQALADDTNWNGHIRGVYEECAARLREILS